MLKPWSSIWVSAGFGFVCIYICNTLFRDNFFNYFKQQNFNLFWLKYIICVRIFTNHKSLASLVRYLYLSNRNNCHFSSCKNKNKWERMNENRREDGIIEWMIHVSYMSWYYNGTLIVMFYPGVTVILWSSIMGIILTLLRTVRAVSAF